MLNIDVLGTDYPAPSSAADANWMAKQVALEQALAAGVNTVATDLAELGVDVDALEAAAVRVLKTNVTPVGSPASTAEGNLMTYTLPASTLAANGQSIRVTGAGTGVSTADATTVRAYFGSALLLTKVLTASQVNNWRLVFEVLRTGASAQVTVAIIENGGVIASTQTTVNTGAEPLSSGVIIGFTGQRAVSSVANSIQQLLMRVELLPAVP